jgi:glutamyl-tRNA synthetase
MAKTRTRFAPSPTGFLHIGSLRTALYAYAMAKHDEGDFILRVEDTDQKREVEGSTEALQETLKKFSLNWDEFYLQSERQKTGIYTRAAEKLVADGNAFYCQCPPKNAKTDGYSLELRDPCRDKGFTSGAVRLKVPDSGEVSYYDFVHKKEISWTMDTVYDATLLKSDGFPTYHLAAMVDDLDMKISHILRGHDWMPSTPIHLLVFKFLGGDRPEIGHLSDILSATTGKKLSKRRDSVFAEQFLSDGYLPEALLNFVMLLGWAPKDNRELFTLDEFVAEFNIEGFQEANPKFLQNKFDWFNGQYIRQRSDEEFLKLVQPFSKYPLTVQIAGLVKERLVKLSEIDGLVKFFFERPAPQENLNKDFLVAAAEAIEKDQDLAQMAKDRGWKLGDFFMALRLAVCGQKVTPPFNESIAILGKAETLSRIKQDL